ncbi:hypothetical protein [Paenibacillus sp. FSL H3-0302]|uniref:hypothetical protein n=1 Tax=Paenibacillus sp. FSL H3-0302 TaxID=2921428 RepID=UPI0030EE79D4
MNKNLRWGVCLAYKQALDHIRDNLLEEGCLFIEDKKMVLQLKEIGIVVRQQRYIHK